MVSPRVSDQLELDLFPGEPWGGRAPRGLTRVRLGLIFKAEAAPPRGAFKHVDQLELFERDRPHREKSPFIYEGAPLLF